MPNEEMNMFGSPTEDLKKKAATLKKDAKDTGIDYVQISNEMNGLSRRVRIMEERYINIRRKTQVTDQNMLLNNKRVGNDIHTVAEDITEIKRDLNDVKEKIKLIVKELNECAKKDDVNVLQKYINLWEPINFVTRNEVEKIVEEMMDKKNQ